MMMLETAALPSVEAVYRVQNFTFFFAPMCCTFVKCNSNCVSFHIWSTSVFLIVQLDMYLLVVLGDFSYMSYAAVMSVYAVGSFLYRQMG
jgi:hypothetical protein